MGICQSAIKALAKPQPQDEDEAQQGQQRPPPGGQGQVVASPPLGSDRKPVSYASAAGSGGGGHQPGNAGPWGAPAAAAPHASYPSPQQHGQSGLSRAIFFPDSAMPCRKYAAGRECRRHNCEYAHTRTSLMELLDELAKARSTLDICVFTITCNEIATGIKEAINRGVAVRIITDDDQMESQGSDVEGLVKAGAQTRHDNNNRSHMHHKFAVVDRATLLSGSFNWTRSAVLTNRENIIITTDPTLINSFAQEFNKMWQLYSGNVVRTSHV